MALRFTIGTIGTFGFCCDFCRRGRAPYFTNQKHKHRRKLKKKRGNWPLGGRCVLGANVFFQVPSHYTRQRPSHPVRYQLVKCSTWPHSGSPDRRLLPRDGVSFRAQLWAVALHPCQGELEKIPWLSRAFAEVREVAKVQYDVHGR